MNATTKIAPKPSDLDNQPVWTVYKAQVSATNPRGELLAPVVFSLTYRAAVNEALRLTVDETASQNGAFYYTCRLNAMNGPVRRWQQMPWGELVPDFS